MPHTHTWEPDGLYRRFTGQVSGDAILESNLELQRDSRFQQIRYVINDFSAITGHTIETGHAQAYAKVDDIISNTKGALKIALVVVHEELLSLANDYRDLMTNKLFECEIFNSLADARRWTGSTAPAQTPSDY